jgi:uncharacterized membrane protein YeaQ/YmgE (transglycosylase-associated protein family)
MGFFSLGIWILYGLIVGLIAKSLHPGDDPVGFLPTVGIGVAGSYVGGFVNFILGKGEALSSSGLVMGIIGGVIFCAAYRWWKLQSSDDVRSFWTGKKK